ncbi:predicted protein, partial [Arabidopsis lyrata subsp. lyrata]
KRPKTKTSENKISSVQYTGKHELRLLDPTLARTAPLWLQPRHQGKPPQPGPNTSSPQPSKKKESKLTLTSTDAHPQTSPRANLTSDPAKEKPATAAEESLAQTNHLPPRSGQGTPAAHHLGSGQRTTVNPFAKW